MSRKRTAIVLGGSGSVGAALLRELFHDDGFDAVITLSRRSLPEVVAVARTAGRSLVEKLVPEMNPAALAAATLDAARDLDGDVEGFSVLGVGAGTAKLTLEEHRAVDVALNEAFARGLRDSGKVRHLAFMSAAGADPTAKASGSGAAGMSRYNRVKGESEEAVRASGPAIVSVFRPAMIIGSQHTPWLLEKTLPLLSFVTPAKYKSITVEQIAKAMIAAAKHHPATSATYHYPEMMALIASGQP
ncbi:NAD(P)H-binding protein [Nannocystis sp. ILAH1]|uniref:NAD(P)H-binding protein n=1 Tax=Nannocystis sp. ILAH1 TaxID=2996789 RepID=UPI002270B27D|nr:NAD(P)H-binding protein [Nannocystis sp. ILAH1]MCY0994947.1 NAD(P)H-binding protein [Nannocystis sp. ILAH1]